MVDRDSVRSGVKEQRGKRKVYEPECQRCQSRPRKFGNWADMEAVDDYPQEIAD